MEKDFRKLELEFDGKILTGIRVGDELFNGYKGGVTVPDGVEWSQNVSPTDDGGISWKFHLVETAGLAERSGFLKVKIPYSYPPYPIMVWSAGRRFPDSVCNIGGITLFYGDVCYGTMIPIVSLYDAKRDIGLTIAKPLGRRGGRFSFHFETYHEEGMEVIFSDFAIKPHAELEFELLLCGHVGCWRPGLRWFADRYPDFFLPHNPNVWNHHGAFAITNPFTKPTAVEKLQASGVQWSEIHNHFPNYGCYAPEVSEWDSVVLHDYPELTNEIPSKISPELIREHIRRLHKHNIMGMLYIQCTGDALIPWAESNFPESIALDSAGNKIPTWKECCFINADPSTPFGKFMDAQIDRFLKMYPEIDGVFIDQLCYQTMDYAHSDGTTCVDGRPAYLFAFSYTHNIEKLTNAIHSAGKIAWGNGPFDIEIAQYVDGIMAEGTSGISESYKYFCIRKPILVHTYLTDDLKVESMLRYCLLAGASWSFGGSSTLREPLEQTPAIKRLFEEYLPLIKPLMDTEFCLDAHPFALPPTYKGEAFKKRNSDTRFITVLGHSETDHIDITINLPHAATARCRGNKQQQWNEIHFDGNTLRLPNDSSAYVIALD